ncbi:protein of unknown function [Amycolatopsis arida]|uniref:DUF4307 domain-containing protein n=1 Tax=Amycolatopsis arida TaxID=587909 RepID=A0A1I5PVQ3_9PSEU|nr:DUF4307 domain-containing protein [Amycolatopsis arida]TDX98611.1 uncharacterized protein DUF4307 [Amycolatopsis arida]SFP37731.1 protein of unknown function [Amycolatopsis arida]
MPTGRPAPTQGTAPAAPPEGRYGSTRRPGRRTARGWRVWVLALVALAVGSTVAYVGYRNLGSAPIEAQRVAFAERPGNAMEITLQVTRDDPSRPGVCIVRVRDLSGAESGRREVLVPPGETTITTVIASIARPVTADVFGCSYDVPEYLSSP